MHVCILYTLRTKLHIFTFHSREGRGADSGRTKPRVKMIRNAFRVLHDVTMTDNCCKLHVGEIKVKAEVSNKYSNMKLNTLKIVT